MPFSPMPFSPVAFVPEKLPDISAAPTELHCLGHSKLLALAPVAAVEVGSRFSCCCADGIVGLGGSLSGRGWSTSSKCWMYRMAAFSVSALVSFLPPHRASHLPSCVEKWQFHQKCQC